MAVILESLTTLSVLVFIVTSIHTIGLNLKIGQVLDPLQDLVMSGKALLALG